MKSSKLQKSLFGSTRGQIVALLRRGSRTVEELALLLGLTGNAVRAHLDSLSRCGVIERRGLRRGSRRPHFAYSLTPEAEDLFPKAYPEMLNQVLAVLKRRMERPELDDVLREVAGSLVPEGNAPPAGSTLDDRARNALKVLEGLGGVAVLEKTNGTIVIRSSDGCPFSAVAARHEEICRLAAMVLSGAAGVNVREQCLRESPPRCFFEFVPDHRAVVGLAAT